MSVVRSQFDATQYFENDEFQSYSLAQDIVDHYPVATTVESDKIYLQDGVVWQEYGEQQLRGELWKILGDASSMTRINETVEAVKHLSRRKRDKLLGLEPHKIATQRGVVNMLAEPGERYELAQNGPGTFTQIPVEYDPEAFPDQFNDFLFEILPRDDVSVIWELIGYCLYRDYPFQKAFMFIGDGANGKSTLLQVLSELLGTKNIATAELQELAENRFAPAQLDGKLANIAPDISSAGIEQTGTFKALTGGDRIRAERKYEDAYHFENHAKLIFSANTVPEAEDNTFAYKRRWLYFDFPYTFSDDDPDAKDPVPQEELLSAFRDEFPGILNLAIESFQDLWERGGFEDTVYMREHEDAHDRAGDSAVAFAKDEIVREKDEYLPITETFETYQAWCNEHDHQAQGKRHFKQRVMNEYSPAKGQHPEDGRVDVWLGLQLRDDKNGQSRQQRL